MVSGAPEQGCGVRPLSYGSDNSRRRELYAPPGF